MILAEPLAKLAVGVNVPVRVRPVPLLAPNVPPETAISQAVPFHTKLVPGSSENVKVIVAVSPAFNAETFEVTVTVGASVSIVTEGDVPADPVLPAASE